MASYSYPSHYSATPHSSRAEWMRHLPAHLHNEPVTKLAIPGSHDSFAYQLTSQSGPDLEPVLRRLRIFIFPIIRNWSVTQDKNFTEQLHMGIRYFDLRVCRTRDRTSYARSPFTFTHGLLAGLVRDGLEEINAFLHRHPKEIVLLDFNHFYDFDEQTGHEQLIRLIHDVFGKRLCTTARTISDCTLSYLWKHQQQVILLYEQNADQCTGYMDRIGHFFKVCQSPWANTAHADDLFVFLDERVSVPRSTNCINVVQGQLTPNNSSIQSNPFSSLHTYSMQTNRRLTEWISHRQRDPSLANGVNVVICDFVDQTFADAVIMLNYKKTSKE